jgi:hypothetical protein
MLLENISNESFICTSLSVSLSVSVSVSVKESVWCCQLCIVNRTHSDLLQITFYLITVSTFLFHMEL